MIEVELPGGAVVEFPDGTSPDVIKGVLSGQYAKEKARPKNLFTHIDDAVRGAADAATFGFADEIAAGANAIPALLDSDRKFSDEYEKNLATERERDKSASPYARVPGQVAGGIGAGMAMVPTGVASLLSRFPVLVRSMMAGAGSGGLYGFGSGEGGVENRLASGGTGAAIGGAAGAAVPLALGAGKSVYTALSPGGASKRAADRVQAAMARDGLDPARVQAGLRELGDEAIPADLEKATNIRGLTRAVSSVPGEGKQVAEELLQGRQMGALPRATAAVNEAFGSTGDDFYQTLETVAAQRAKDAEPLYKQAYDQPVAFTQSMEDFLDTDIAQKAFAKAKGIWVAENAAKRLSGQAADEPQWFVKIMQDGSIEDLKAVPNTRLWDYMVRGLDDMLETYRDKTTNKLVLDTQGRALSNVRRSLDSALKDANPTYRAAKEAWAGPSKAMSAMERGRSFIRRDAEITAKEFSGMSASEREMFGMGMARGIRDIMQSVPDGANVVRRLTSTPAIREKISTVIKDPATRDAFESALGREVTFNKTRNAILSGSRTTPLAQEIEDAGITGFAGLAGDAARAAQGQAGGMLNLMGRGASAVANRYRAGASEKTRDELTKLLFPRSGADQDSLVQALLQRQKLAQLSDRAAMGGTYGATVPMVGGGN